MNGFVFLPTLVAKIHTAVWSQRVCHVDSHTTSKHGGGAQRNVAMEIRTEVWSVTLVLVSAVCAALLSSPSSPLLSSPLVSSPLPSSPLPPPLPSSLLLPNVSSECNALHSEGISCTFRGRCSHRALWGPGCTFRGCCSHRAPWGLVPDRGH